VDGWSVAFGVAVAAGWVLGLWLEPYFVAGGTGWLPAFPPLLAVVGVLLACGLSAAAGWAFRRFDHAAEDGAADASSGDPACVPVRDVLARAGILLASWLPYLLVRFPGNIDDDTVVELMQHYGLAPASDHHPWFDTQVFGLFWDLGGVLGSHLWSLLVFSLAQMAVTALALGLSLVYLRRRMGAPAGFVRGSTIFLAAFPFVPLVAQSMAKDMLFSWVYVLFLMCYVEVALTRGKALANRRFALACLAVTLLLMLAKKTGMYVCGAAGVVLLLWSRERRCELALGLVVAFALFCGGWTALLHAWDVDVSPSGEALSVAAQQTARVMADHGSEVDQADRTTLSAVWYELDTMGAGYVAGRSDAEKWRWNATASTSDKLAYLGLYCRLGLRYPGTYALAFLGTTIEVFAPVVNAPLSSDASYESSLWYLDKVGTDERDYERLVYFGMSDDTARSLMGGATRPAWSAAASDVLDQAYSAIVGVCPWPFSKAPYLAWIPLAVLLYACRRRSALVAVCLWPVLLNLGSVLLGPIALPRYMVAAVYAAPLALGMAFLAGRDKRDVA
jgi:hypothetical protein